MIWFTSDLHIGHKNISGPSQSSWKSGYRTFPTLEEHDNTLINTLNKYVQPTDTLYILGDITFKSREFLEDIFYRINCNNIHCLLGNHDSALSKIHASFPSTDTEYPSIYSKVKSINHYLKLNLNNTTLILFHYPIASWENMYRNSIQLHGHSHNRFTPKGRQLDVGVDSAYHRFNEYRPFSLPEIIELLKETLPDLTIETEPNND